MIDGGYILQPRCIKYSDIAHAPPHVREIWAWILLEANHTDTNVCKRGQLIRTYKDIQEDLHWMVGYRKETYKKHHCEIAMKWLRKATMITTMKTTRGIVITVINYDKFQDPKNYESYTKATAKTTMKLQPTDTINKNERMKEEIYTSKFLEFWDLYPSRKGKGAAVKAYDKVKSSHSEIITGLKAQLPELKTKDKQYIPHPTTWLNQRRWEDETTQTTSTIRVL